MFSHKHLLHFARFVCVIVILFGLSLITNVSNVINTFAATYEASISTSGSITLDVSPAGNGASVTTDELTVISTCPEGYEVWIQGPADTTLYKDGNKSNTVATKKINASAGTKDTPRGIIGTDTTSGTSNMNTWGYSIGDPATAGGTTTFTPATIHSTSFIGLNNKLTSLYTKNSGTTSTGDKLPIYYGVSVDASIETGSYTMAETTTGAGDNKITYSIVTNLNCMTYQVAFDPSAEVIDDYGNTITVTGTGTMPNQRIKEGIATPLTTNAFTAPEGYTFVGWNTKQDGTGTSYTNGQSVTDIATPGNTITLYAQWTDCPPNKICYKDNGANSPTKMDNQSIANPTTATEATLWASNFQYRDATKPDTVTVKGFAGWNTKYDGSGTSYGPNETISFIAGQYSNGGLKLYAMWVESAGDLQGWTCPDDTTMPVGTVTALTDQRDGNTYAVAKLADGKCWMIENLRLADQTLTTANTNNPLNNGTDVTLKNTDGTTTNHLSASTNPTATAWCTDVTSACLDQSMLYTGNTTNPATNISQTFNQNIYSYGNYYNWYSATAGRGTYSKTSGNTEGDICPAGWHLPTGYTGGEFYAINTQVNSGSTSSSVGLRAYPNNFVYSGFVGGYTVYDQGRGGSYWSSTAGGSYDAYFLKLGSILVYPGTHDVLKYQGFMARCVLGS